MRWGSTGWLACEKHLSWWVLQEDASHTSASNIRCLLRAAELHHPPWCGCYCFMSIMVCSPSLLGNSSPLSSYRGTLVLFSSSHSLAGNQNCSALVCICSQLNLCNVLTLPKFKHGRITMQNFSQGEAVTPVSCCRAPLVFPKLQSDDVWHTGGSAQRGGLLDTLILYWKRKEPSEPLIALSFVLNMLFVKRYFAGRANVIELATFMQVPWYWFLWMVNWVAKGIAKRKWRTAVHSCSGF